MKLPYPLVYLGLLIIVLCIVIFANASVSKSSEPARNNTRAVEAGGSESSEPTRNKDAYVEYLGGPGYQPLNVSVVHLDGKKYLVVRNTNGLAIVEHKQE